MISTSLDIERTGQQLHELATRLYPICRSQTGDGVRDTLSILGELIPLDLHEVPSGSQVFDWTVPPEWNVRDAYVMDQAGQRVIDFRDSNLHLVNGSLPVNRAMTWPELKPHLYSLPDQPDWIPYRTCFFREDWGFCLTHHRLEELAARGEQRYEVVIDTTLEPGALTYGELLLPGESPEEVLFSAHVCHPSLANDNLSGLSIATSLAANLANLPRRRYSYRFLFAPATIGAITWLALNQDRLDPIRHGLVLSLLGDSGHSTYKRSRSGTATIDRVVEHVLRTSGQRFEILDFVPFGYDERQFCSPGINLPMGCLMRTPNGQFPEYHTSADDLSLIKPDCLADSLVKCLKIVEVLEHDARYLNLRPQCEPRLGQHGLYESLPATADRLQVQQAVQWVLNFSDGNHTLFEISERSGLEFHILLRAARLLVECNLISRLDNSTRSPAARGTEQPVHPVSRMVSPLQPSAPLENGK